MPLHLFIDWCELKIGRTEPAPPIDFAPVLQQIGLLEADVHRVYLQLRKQEGSIMAVSAAIAAFSQRVNVATTEIAKDLKALRDAAAQGPLSAEDLAKLDEIASNLEAMGVDPEAPIVETEPEENA